MVMSDLSMNQFWKYRFTVFTATFNRAHTLTRVYDSLKQQTFRDFEWLVIDNGSQDKTQKLIKTWQKENLFPIRLYFRQVNEHRKVAFNQGVKEAEGELFLNWDSDDEAVPNALEIFDRHWQNIPDNEKAWFSGVSALCVDQTGKLVGSRFPKDTFDSDFFTLRYRFNLKCEKWGFQRTDVLRRFPFPENVQGLVPESVVWSAISQNYKTRFVNDILRIFYINAGESVMTSSNPRKDSDGLALWAQETLNNELKWFFVDPLWFLKTAANYTRFSLHLKDGQPGKRWPLHGIAPYLLVLLMWPVGWCHYMFEKQSAISKLKYNATEK